MSETFFPFKDLMRRKFQTGIIVASVTLSVAATLFLLMFGSEIGIGISAAVEGRLSVGFSSVLSRFVLFLDFLVFAVGAVIVSFVSFLMMSQRTRDIGLMKVAGCPNDRILYYFRTELLTVTFLGCLLGIIFGILSNFALVNFFSISGVPLQQTSINPWFVSVVFLSFFFMGIIFGGKPISDATSIEPVKAISSTYYHGLKRGPSLKTLSKSHFTWKIAVRNLYRHKSATLRIVFCLTAVFLLVTVAVAGGIIADQTTTSWVEKATGKDLFLIAHQDLANQYGLLLSKFYEENIIPQFNYTRDDYFIPQALPGQLESAAGVSVDARLITQARVREIPGYTIDSFTGDAIPVGSNRAGASLIVGIDPQKVLTDWFLDGEFLQPGQGFKAVVGDAVGQELFDSPLDESILIFNQKFSIVGVSIDPTNNGNVTYMPLQNLENALNTTQPNMLLVKIDPSVNQTQILNRIRAIVQATNSEFTVTELNSVLSRSLDFLGEIWSTIMFSPAFSLVAATICLVGYVVLSINEQRQELGILRAVGARPRTVIEIISGQSLIILTACFLLGAILGISLTLLILIPKPLVIGSGLMEIIGGLLIVFATTFVFALYPAVKFARKPILETMA